MMTIEFTPDSSDGGPQHVLNLMMGLTVEVKATPFSISYTGEIVQVGENWLGIQDYETDERHGFHIDTIETVTYQ